MTELKLCPSTLAEGYDSYSPDALNALFDGAEVSPYLDFPGPSADNRALVESAKAVGRISLSGVQPKFSLVADGGTLRYTKQGEQGTHILKPNPGGYHLLNREHCAANEHLTMQIASQVYGIETAANGLCFFSNGEPAYITRRFDVHAGGKYQQEDFASVMGFTKANGGSDYKYCNSSYEECSLAIKKLVKESDTDLLRFFRVILFNFISLNDDAHLKNFSLIKYDDGYRLSPAYDLINTSLHLFEPRIFALDKGLFSEGTKIDDTHWIGKNEFVDFGRRIGLPEQLVKQEIERFSMDSPASDELIRRSFLPSALKKQYREAMCYRRKMLVS